MRRSSFAPDLGPSGALRLAELLGALSFMTDLATGVPMETNLRTCLVAVLLGNRLGFGGAEISSVYYTALLRHLGCSGTAREGARLMGGDDLRLRSDVERAYLQSGRGEAQNPWIQGGSAPSGDPRAALSRAIATAQCAQAEALASDLGMWPAVCRALSQSFERFDGRGGPAGLQGAELEWAARIVRVAEMVQALHRHGGRVATESAVRDRCGSDLDPAVAGAFVADPAPFWEVLEGASVWESYLDAEPDPARCVDSEDLDGVARAFAHFADLKVPHRIGHSPSVAERAEQAGAAAGLGDSELAQLRLAALLHDIGIVGVSNSVWEKAGPLNSVEWEQVRLHSYYSERILRRAPALAPAVAAIAGGHHERHDGSGYPRGVLPVNALAAELLAAADVFTALTEGRPYRDKRAPAAAAEVLVEEARAGRLSDRAVECVLANQKRVAPGGPRRSSGLTPRETEVLVEVARGCSNKEIACQLDIALPTVKRHLESIFRKVQITTRSAAALYAVRHGLLSSLE